MDAVEGARHFDVADHLARVVDPSIRIGFQRCDETIRNGQFRDIGRELRAIVADVGTITPAKTGPAKTTCERQARSAGSDQLTWTKRKSASRFHAGRRESRVVTPTRR